MGEIAGKRPSAIENTYSEMENIFEANTKSEDPKVWALSPTLHHTGLAVLREAKPEFAVAFCEVLGAESVDLWPESH